MKHFISFIAIFITTMFTSYIDVVGEMEKQHQIEHEARLQEFKDLRNDIDELRERLESLNLEPNEEILRILENN